jgi:hypothetical protein
MGHGTQRSEQCPKGRRSANRCQGYCPQPRAQQIAKRRKVLLPWPCLHAAVDPELCKSWASACQASIDNQFRVAQHEIRPSLPSLQVRLQLEVLNKDPPAGCSHDIQKLASEAVRRVSGLRSKHMVSHAYHDSLFVAQVAPTGMLFIPCYKGYSHRPDEFASPDSMERGVKVLALTLAGLSGSSEVGATELDKEL